MAGAPSATVAQETKPNILVIMGDDIGWENLGSYHQGLMLDATPNLDKLAKQGLRFTDYYAEASCNGGPRQFHHWGIADPDWTDDGRPGGLPIGYAGPGADDRQCAQGARL
jgi:Sulfatase